MRFCGWPLPVTRSLVHSEYFLVTNQESFAYARVLQRLLKPLHSISRTSVSAMLAVAEADPLSLTSHSSTKSWHLRTVPVGATVRLQVATQQINKLNTVEDTLIGKGYSHSLVELS